MFMARASIALVLVGLLVSTAVLTPAQKKSRTHDAARHASDAAKTFTEIMNVKDQAIPKELLDTAEAIAVFPGVIKAAFLVGGRGGQGVISRRRGKYVRYRLASRVSREYPRTAACAPM